MHADTQRTPGPALRGSLPWLLAGTAIVYLVRLGAAGLYDSAEGTYAEISREMLVLRDWLTPHFNFVRYFEKPPLLYWLNSAAYALFGTTQFSARLPTALAAIAGVGLVHGIGRTLWGRAAGLFSGVVLATSLGYFIFGRIALPDMLFTALLTAAFWGFARGLLGDAPRPAAVIAAYAAMGCAVLAKGLIGVVFPALTIAGFVLVTRDWRLLRRLEFIRGGAVFLAIAAPWHVLAGIRNPGFFWFYFINEHVLRFLGRRDPIDYAALPVGTYLGMTAIWFFPWTGFLPVALARHWPRGPADEGARGFLFVAIWAIVVIGFFALCRSRLEYYALPALPALALCVGRLWAGNLVANGPPAPSRGLAAGWIALAAGAAALVPVSLLFSRLEHLSFYNMFQSADDPVPGLSPALLAQADIYSVPSFAAMTPLLEAATAVLFVGAAGAALAWFRRRPWSAVAALAAAQAVFLLILQNGFAIFEPHRSIVRLASALRAEFRPGQQILIDGPYENFASVDFYTGQPSRVYHGHFGDLQFGFRYPEAKAVFVDDAQLAAIWRGPARAYLFTDDAARLTELQALSPDTQIVGRTAQNWLFANRPDPGGPGRPPGS